jgi:hypothetical protein
MKKLYWGSSRVGGTLAALTLAIACGDGFAGGSDCRANRTCEASDGGSPDDGSPQGGADAVAGHAETGGDDGVSYGGAAGAAGGSDVECHVDADCSNGVDEDGQEGCEQGACQPGNPPPTVISVSPKDQAVDVEPDTRVVIEFSEPLDAKTITPSTIEIKDGETVVPGMLEYQDGKVTFTPSSPLALLAPYTVNVGVGVKDKDGTPLLEKASSAFTIRDGAWTTIDAVKDRISTLAPSMPMAADGSSLLAWSGTVGSNCPVSARWFASGAPTAPAKSFPVGTQADCNGVTAGGNASGVAAVVWNEPDSAYGSDVVQYRDGAWQATPTLVSKDPNSYHFTVAASPSGVLTFFEQSIESKAWTTNDAGHWPTSGDVLGTYQSQSRTSVAFDSKGNGLAVFSAQNGDTKLERIVSSRFSVNQQKWATAVDLPGSVAATSSVDVQRGVPVVALDNKGDGLALWVNASSGSKLFASRFEQTSGWQAPEPVSGALIVETLHEPPALVFDGEAYVAAWTAQEGGMRYTYTARYGLTTGWESYQKQQTAAGDGTSARRMPRLTSDGRGNLMLVYAKGASPAYSLMYQRFSNGTWGTITLLPGGAITDPNFDSGDVLPMSGNGSGRSALAWAGAFDASNHISVIRLASFY